MEGKGGERRGEKGREGVRRGGNEGRQRDGARGREGARDGWVCRARGPRALTKAY
jgi:hypothetical protein